ncbi:hypothetical protein SESBI_38634 [Sesbania bispinosa]|nr:hypothetical protein SESBI_38634 [Sesbania bispinosa]
MVATPKPLNVACLEPPATVVNIMCELRCCCQMQPQCSSPLTVVLHEQPPTPFTSRYETYSLLQLSAPTIAS